MVNNNDLLQKIQEWEEELTINDKHIHFALLEIFIEFEKFLTSSFVGYALGDTGKDSFQPTKRVAFDDKIHLEGFLKCEKPFIDYVKKIENIKKYIFLEATCPFNKIFSTSEFTSAFKQIQTLRNLIAHQSEESKNKYISNVLGAYGIGNSIKVDTFLKKIKGNRCTYYSFYIDILRFHSEVICNPNPSIQEG